MPRPTEVVGGANAQSSLVGMGTGGWCWPACTQDTDPIYPSAAAVKLPVLRCTNLSNGQLRMVASHHRHHPFPTWSPTCRPPTHRHRRHSLHSCTASCHTHGTGLHAFLPRLILPAPARCPYLFTPRCDRLSADPQPSLPSRTCRHCSKDELASRAVWDGIHGRTLPACPYGTLTDGHVCRWGTMANVQQSPCCQLAMSILTLLKHKAVSILLQLHV